MDYKEAKQYLENAQIDKCEHFFENNNYKLEYGYCKLLKNEVNEARKIFTPLREYDMRADWAYLFIQFMNNYIQYMPTYFQVRNFLEIDIALLLKSGLSESVENVINACDIFYQINQESYKFIARVLLNYNYPSVAKIFLNRGVERCYNDPELHFLYGNYHLKCNNNILAKREFETSLEVLPDYYPAKMMLKKL